MLPRQLITISHIFGSLFSSIVFMLINFLCIFLFLLFVRYKDLFYKDFLRTSKIRNYNISKKE